MSCIRDSWGNQRIRRAQSSREWQMQGTDLHHRIFRRSVYRSTSRVGKMDLG